MSEYQPSGEKHSPDYSSVKWATELFKDRGLDSISDASMQEAITLIAESVDGAEIGKLVEAKDAEDPNVFLKNRFLAKLVELGVGQERELTLDFLALLENQAETLDDQPHETRHRQFKGLLDIIVTCFSDEELHRLFEERKYSLNYNLGPVNTPPPEK
jgi:hypothetical protein